MSRSRLRPASIAVCLALAMVACASERAEYLKGSVNTATQDDVVKRLGPPTSTSQADGKTVWIYQYETGPEYRYGRSVSRPDCREILTFDQQKILKDWTREDCRD